MPTIDQSHTPKRAGRPRLFSPGRRGPLAVRPFRVFLISQAVSVIGDSLTLVALPFAVLRSGGSASDVGLVLAARTVPLVLLLIFGGVIADRLPRRRLLIGSNATAAVTQVGLGLLAISADAPLWGLAATCAVYGAVQALARPASVGVLPELLPKAMLGEGNATLGLVTSISTIAGTALGGLVVAAVDPGTAILGDAGSFLFSALLVSRIAFGATPVTVASGFRSQLSEGWSFIRGNVWVWASILYFALYQFAVPGGVNVLGPVVAQKELGGAGEWGLLLAVSGVGSIAGGMLLLRYMPARQLVATYLALLAAFPLLLVLGFAPNLPLLAVAQFAFGASLTFSAALWYTVLQQQVPEDMLGRVSAYDLLGSTALRPFGLALIGPLAGLVGLEMTLLGAAVLLAAATAAVLAIPAVRRIRAPEPKTAELA